MNAQTTEHLAWTLAHSIWQGALIALLAIVLKSAVRSSAEWRYRISVGAMALMLLVPLVTFILYPTQTLPAYGGEDSLMRTVVTLYWTPNGPPAKETIPWTTWIVFAWFTGVFCLSLRLVVGWKIAQSLVRTATNSVPKNTRSVFDRLIARIPMRRVVRLLTSDRVPTAVVIGWLRPVILLPLAAATGLTFEQLEAILAHELAHIRRHDFAVNVLQCCTECLLFYHPAVWWMSSEIRREREHCCDDLAISICGDRVIYASALVELESARGKPMLAMAASGSDLARRIRRIFGQDAASAGWKDAAWTAVLVLALLAGSAFYGMRAEAEQRPAATEASMPTSKDTQLSRLLRPGDASDNSARNRTRDPNAWVLFDSGRTWSRSPDRMRDGKNVDLEAALAAHRALGNKSIIWFRIDGRTGIVQDKATMARIEKLLPTPMKESEMSTEQRAALHALNAMPQPMRLRQMSPQDRAKVEKLARIVEGGRHYTDAGPQALQIMRGAIGVGLAESAP